MVARPWTEDWAKCQNTCVGQYISRLGVNQIPDDNYLCFYFQMEENTCLYGVFEPHNGVDAAKELLQRLAAEILFQKISLTTTDEEIRDMLRNAFVLVEKEYMKNFDGKIAIRTSLQDQLHTMTQMQISQNCDNIISRLKEIDQHLAEGATVVVAFVHYDKLFVANVGEARALLCRTDENSVLRVVQLSVDHSLNNEDELLRLSQLGLDVNKLRNGAQYLGNQTGTRCLGNYLVKGLYKAFKDIKGALSEPVIPTPEIHGPIILDESCRFLVLVSAGVHKRIQEVRGCGEQTNKQLAQAIVETSRRETDYGRLSRTVLRHVEDEFLTHCLTHNLTPKPNTHMTLLIRNFNFPLPNAAYVPKPIVRLEDALALAKNLVRFNPIVQSKSTTLDVIDTCESMVSPVDSQLDTNRSVSSDSSECPHRNADPNRRIEGYVDFTCYYENVEKARRNGTLPGFIK